jgi:hypothetical protein
MHVIGGVTSGDAIRCDVAGGSDAGFRGSIVGNITGNLSGNVTGSVGSVATGGITSSSIATDAIDGDALSSSATDEIGNSVWAATSRTLTSAEVRISQNVLGIPDNDPLPPAYTAGDAVGTQISFNLGTNQGVIVGCRVLDEAKQSVPLELWLFRATTTAGLGDNSEFDPDDDQILNLAGVLRVNDWFNTKENSIGQAENLPLAFAGLSSNMLYGWLVTRAAPSFVENQLTVELDVLPS